MSDADDRAEVELNLPDDVLFQLMLAAHQHDITLNQMVERLLRQEIDRESAVDENPIKES